MAMATLAGTTPVNGLYALMVGTPVGALVGSSVFMNIGITSAMALATASAVASDPSQSPVTVIITLTLLVGIFQILAGLLKMGRLMRFVSNAVMVGFLTGVSVSIILGQIPDLTGVSTPYKNSVAKAAYVLANWQSIQVQSLLIGLLTIALIIFFDRTRLRNFAMLLGMVIASLAVLVLGWSMVSTVGYIPSGLPTPKLPDLSGIPPLIIPAISLAIIGLVQAAGVSKGYPNPDGAYPDASRDFAGQGAANVAASLFQGMPVGGSISTTALNRSSGAQTRWANVFSGAVIALAVLLFSRAVGYVATPAMAGLLIVAGYQSVKIGEIEDVWQTSWNSRLVGGVTFVATLLLPVQYAVFLGVVLSGVVYVISASSEVRLTEVVPQPGGLYREQPPPAVLPGESVTILVVYGSVFFAGADKVQNLLPSADGVKRAVVILRLREHTQISSTFIKVLERYEAQLHAGGGKLILAGIGEHVKEQLDRTQKTDTLLGAEDIFLATSVLGESTLAALNAAQAWLEESKPAGETGEARTQSQAGGNPEEKP